VGDYTCKLTLWIEHPDADLSDIPNRLGLKAERLWKKGDPRITPSGRARGGYYRSSYCNIPFAADRDGGLPADLLAAIAILKPHQAYLAGLTAAGIKLRFFVGWFSELNSRDVLDWTLLKEIAALHISLDLDFYGPDPAKETSD
jgi:hypothetical protein